jgi:hypothetical protein
MGRRNCSLLNMSPIVHPATDKNALPARPLKNRATQQGLDVFSYVPTLLSVPPLRGWSCATLSSRGLVPVTRLALVVGRAQRYYAPLLSDNQVTVACATLGKLCQISLLPLRTENHNIIRDQYNQPSELYFDKPKNACTIRDSYEPGCILKPNYYLLYNPPKITPKTPLILAIDFRRCVL